MEEYEPQYRSHYDSHFASTHLGYNEIRSAYHFGAHAARDNRFSRAEWNAVEPTIQQDWEASHPELKWSAVKDAVFTGWQLAHTTTP
jgi:hypothetical protein